MDRQVEIRSCNAAAGRLFGYSASEDVGKSCYGLLQGTSSLGTKRCAPEFYVRQVTAEDCRIPNFDLDVTVRSGRRIRVDLPLLFEDGRTHSRLMVHLSHYVTERKQHEDLLHKML